jgi:hypothetical protein
LKNTPKAWLPVLSPEKMGSQMRAERRVPEAKPVVAVETFEQYLACGDLARGFVRCHCDGCGHDVLVA